MADNSFNNTVESLFKGMDSFITTKTVVGDAIHIGDTIILPLVDVSFGVAAGAFSQVMRTRNIQTTRIIIMFSHLIQYVIMTLKLFRIFIPRSVLI